MKYYSLTGVVAGQTIQFRKKFKRRNDAINYMFKYYGNHYLGNLTVEDTIEIKKHNVEYVCNQYNRFIISRSLA